jgi:hypothetical protein
MFHDIGKFFCLDWLDGKPIYYGHDEIGSQEIYKIGEKMKMSNKDLDVISFVCKHHMNFWNILDMNKTKYLNIILDKRFKYLLAACEADEKSRLYLVDNTRFDNLKKKIKIDIKLFKNKKKLDDKLKALFTGKDIMNLRDGIEGKDI